MSKNFFRVSRERDGARQLIDGQGGARPWANQYGMGKKTDGARRDGDSQKKSSTGRARRVNKRHGSGPAGHEKLLPRTSLVPNTYHNIYENEPVIGQVQVQQVRVQILDT